MRYFSVSALCAGLMAAASTSLCLWASPATGGEARLTVQGQGAYVRLRLPAAVQALARESDLSDLQIVNARGEPLPFSWLQAEATTELREGRHAVPFFKAPKQASAVSPAQQGGWIVDLRSVTDERVRLELRLPLTARGIYSVAVDTSNDLQQWEPLLSAAQVLSLEQGGHRLEQTHVDLEGAGSHSRYLRLRPLPGSAELPLEGATLMTQSRQVDAPPLNWSAPVSPSQCTAQYCDYPLARNLPLDRVDIQFSDINTLAPVRMLVQNEPRPAPQASAHHHHGLRHALRTLRRKNTAAPPVDAGWAWLNDTTAYWLQLAGGKVQSPPVTLDGGHYRTLRLQAAQANTAWGPKPPTLRIGSRASSLAFLARGPGPYRIVWGGADATQVLPLSQLMPRLPTSEADFAVAVVEWAGPDVSASVPSKAVAPAPAVPEPPRPARVYWLWAALAVALGLMGAMAWSLLKSAPRQDA